MNLFFSMALCCLLSLLRPIGAEQHITNVAYTELQALWCVPSGLVFFFSVSQEDKISEVNPVIIGFIFIFHEEAQSI